MMMLVRIHLLAILLLPFTGGLARATGPVFTRAGGIASPNNSWSIGAAGSANFLWLGPNTGIGDALAAHTLGTVLTSQQAFTGLQTRTTSRPPTAADDGAHGRQINDLWMILNPTRMWRLDDATTGFGGWTEITNAILPGDALGLRINAATVVAGGSNHAIGDILTLPNKGSLAVLGIAKAAPLTLTSPTYDTMLEKFGTAALSGGTGYATPAFYNPTAWAAEIWIKTTGTAQMVALGDAGTISLAVDSSGHPYAYCAGGGLKNSTVSVINGMWHHLAMSSAPAGMSLFVDGTLIGTTTTPCTAVPAAIGVGYQADNGTGAANTSPWSGTLDEPALWNTARYSTSFTVPTAAYVGTEAGLTGLYHLDSNGNDGHTIVAGQVTAATVNDPHWMACAATAPTGVAPIATTGVGTGATFNLAMLYPVLQGTHLMTRCYTGPEKRVMRADTGAVFDVPFLAGGVADDAAEDQFAAGVVPFVLDWYNQGGGPSSSVGDATSVYTAAPVSYAGRRLGNARPIMFNHLGNTQQLESSNALTSLNYGSTLTSSTGANTLAALGSAMDVGQSAVAFIQIGAILGLGQGTYNIGASYISNGQVYVGNTIREDGSLMMGSANGLAGLMYLDGRFTAGSLSSATSTLLTGGALAAPPGGNTGLLEEDMVINAPWSTTQADMLTIAEATYQAYGIQPQGQNIVALLGHSLVEGYASQYQQSWSRKLIENLARPDTHFVNFATGGDTCAHQLSVWPTIIAPTLANYSGTKTVFMMCGDNDQAAGTSAAGIVALYTQFVALAHASGAKAICGAAAYANRGGGSYSTVLAFQTALGVIENTIAATSGCDEMYDERVQPIFGSLSGPWTGPLYNQADQVHKTNLGQAVEENIMRPFMSLAIGP